MNYLCKWGSF